MDPLTSPLGMRWVIQCPVNNCPWEMDRTKPPLGLVQLGHDGNLDMSRAFTAATAADDEACRRHLETHTVDEWVATVADLHHQLGEARRQPA
ncbi:hypothetical protein [Micromonospora sp. NBC_00421]|uniref:hypothetical protein n=1 Tax=Micromonospora sp. NBC_00421 TaxID=2975976 RepID=UPI002E210429